LQILTGGGGRIRGELVTECIERGIIRIVEYSKEDIDVSVRAVASSFVSPS
jgi:hypothetical protein